MVLFRCLYARHCRVAYQGVSDSDPGEHCQAVEREFKDLFSRLSETTSAAHLRRGILASRRDQWCVLVTSTTCLFCLRRPPEQVLPCGHSLCDVCVRILGAASRKVPWWFELDHCPVCQNSCSLTVRLLPPTKRPNILVLDGGGVRGIVTLKFLQDLEQRWGSPGLSQIFDLAVGTSAGESIIFRHYVATRVFTDGSMLTGYRLQAP